MSEPVILVVAKALIAASGLLLFMLPLATAPGLLAGIAGTLLAYLLARAAAARGLRVPAGVIVGALVLGAARLVSQWVLDAAPAGTVSSIEASDAIFFGVGALGLFFAIRILSQRAHVFSVLELAVVVGAVAHTFSEHRHQRIHQPRFLSDWAWSHGIDPSAILAGAGVVALVLSVVLLLRTRRAAAIFLGFLVLLLGGAAVYFLLGRTARLTPEPDTNGIGLSKSDKDKNDKDKNGGGGGDGSSNAPKPPDPVAVVLLHDELPDAPVFYFRQAVLSRFAVDRLTEDSSGQYDQDVFRSFPRDEAERTDSPQNPAFHRLVRTSMFLLVDHAQPLGIGNPIELRPLENPDPRRFVAAYDVDSQFFTTDPVRLIGRTAMPATWTAEQRAHYTTIPSDPRYRELSNKLIRDMDPRFVGDDLMKALTLKRYLEQKGFYSLKQKTLVGDDPTGKFLFGEMRGYCVHFAHAAVFLLRSQGIPARVSLGYAVQTARRGAGSSLLILGNEAHAWPELYVDGVGWVTFDIYPEHSDEPPPAPFDQDLENVLGELARKDKTGGKGADPDARWDIPWTGLSIGFLSVLGGLVVLAYGTKIFRRLSGGSHRHVYRGVLDVFSDLGAPRAFGETREKHARRLAALAPSFADLTREHLRHALGRGDADLRPLARAVRAELAQNTSRWARARAFLNPVGWWFTR